MIAKASTEPPRPRGHDPAGRRAAVLMHAAQIFAARGYEHASIAEIARAAGVAVGTVYRFFPDKPALLAALHAEIEGLIVTAMRAGWDNAPSKPQRFAAMFDALMDAAAANLPLMPLFAMTRELVGSVDYRAGDRIRAEIRALLAIGIADGQYRAVDTEVIANLGFGGIEAVLMAWAADPTPAHRARLTREVTAFFDRALVAAG